jgi:hypothetical protein
MDVTVGLGAIASSFAIRAAGDCSPGMKVIGAATMLGSS